MHLKMHLCYAYLICENILVLLHLGMEDWYLHTESCLLHLSMCMKVMMFKNASAFVLNKKKNIFINNPYKLLTFKTKKKNRSVV